MQGGWWPQIDESMVVVDRLDGTCTANLAVPLVMGFLAAEFFFGATSADGQRAMKPSGSTVTKCGGSAVKNDWQWKMPIFYIYSFIFFYDFWARNPLNLGLYMTF